MPEHHRDQDGYIPAQAKWIMTFINRIGFPIAVCIYFAWLQATQGKRTIEALNNVTEVIGTLNRNIEAQTKMLRHRGNRDE